ncbi:hypothetical protein FO519_005520 [Halicephalobus sp. NKZ332]|nr:hypothetical protein FO519_005520 [Halicephalobus sp. NKZ332]
MVQDIHSHYSLSDFHRFNEIGKDKSKLFDDDEDFLFSPSSYSALHTTLSNGVQMPLLGLGTTHSGGYNHDAVVFALRKCGYRMIDTAKRYGVENKIGKAISDSGVPREDIFINTKIWPTDFKQGVKNVFEASCRRLNVDYLDSYMIHLPIILDNSGDQKTVLQETWRQMEKLYESEKVKSIGVSNFEISDLETILEDCSVNPHLNQCEFHPCQNPTSLRDYCKENKITFSGYCPLAKGRILNLDQIQKIAKKHGKTAAQICIRWSIQNGVSAIPKSRKLSRLFENSLVFDFELSPEEMFILDNLHLTENMKVIEFNNIKDTMYLPDGYNTKMIDTHCHLADDAFSEDLDEVITRAKNAGVQAAIVCAEFRWQYEKILEMSKKYPDFVMPAVGTHPIQEGHISTTLEDFQDTDVFVKDHHEEIIGLGEVGLDSNPRFLKDPDLEKKIQQDVLLKHIQLSKDFDLPLNVHSRSAGKPAINFLLANGAEKVHMHAFDGNAKSAKPGIEAGYYFSVPPSFARKEEKKSLVAAIPLDRILLETDSPVLGPEPGERNEPANIRFSAEFIAIVKKISVEEVIRQTTENALRLYPKISRSLLKLK